MSMEFIAIISASIALAGLIITGQNSLRKEMQEQRKEMQEQRKEMQEQRKEMQEQGSRLDKEIKEQGARLGKQISEQGKEIEGVKIEVASLRATVETYFRVRVDPPPTAAVAETPEDYGAG